MARITGLSRLTVARLLAPQERPPIAETVRPLMERPILEIDELGSFVDNKAQEIWIWIALERQTRRMVGLAFGDRSAHTCQKLWDRQTTANGLVATPTSGPPIKLSGRPSVIDLLARKLGKLPPSNASTTPGDSVVPISCVKPCLSASTSSCTSFVFAASSTMTIDALSALLFSHPFNLDHYLLADNNPSKIC